MVSTNTQNKLPSKALSYFLTTRIIVGLILIVIGIVLLSLGTVQGTSTVNGVTSPTTFPTTIPGIIAILLGIVVPLWTVLWFSMFSYTLTNQSVTINSGVVFRKSRSIDFSKIQSVDNSRGPLQMMFGITSVNIWTASPSQMQFSTVGTGNNARTVSTPKPDGQLYLLQQDAEEVKNFIGNKGTV